MGNEKMEREGKGRDVRGREGRRQCGRLLYEEKNKGREEENMKERKRERETRLTGNGETTMERKIQRKSRGEEESQTPYRETGTYERLGTREVERCGR